MIRYITWHIHISYSAHSSPSSLRVHVDMKTNHSDPQKHRVPCGKLSSVTAPLGCDFPGYVA